MIDVVTFGETMALMTAPAIGPLRHATSLKVGVAGAESNVAIGLNRLGSSARWIGRVGNDEFGRLITSTIRGQGVLTTAIIDHHAPTGLMVKERRASGVARVVYYRAASAGSRLSVDDVDETAIAQARVLHLSGITPALSVSAREAIHSAFDAAETAGRPVSFDLNYRSALWSPEEARETLQSLVPRAAIIFATEDEARLIVEGESAQALAIALSKLGPSQVVIKRGALGSVAVAEDRAFEVPAIPVAEIDPVGAGDAFTAGYLSELCQGSEPEVRLQTASLTGAFAVTVDGDWEGAPERAELAFLGGSSDGVMR